MANDFREEQMVETPKKAAKKQTQEEEYVEIFVEFPEGEPQERFFSVTNGKTDKDYLLKGGEYVMVPKSVAKLYYQCKKQTAAAKAYQKSLEDQELSSM